MTPQNKLILDIQIKTNNMKSSTKITETQHNNNNTLVKT